MLSPIIPPAPGDSITADHQARVCERLQRLLPIAGPNIHLGYTRHGVRISARQKDPPARHPLACWDIGSDEYGNSIILRPYLNIGGVTVEATDLPALDDIVGKLLAAKVRIEMTSSSLLPSITATAAVYDDLADMMSHQKDSPNETIIPIWSLAEEGGMTADYRNMPHVQMTETLAS